MVGLFIEFGEVIHRSGLQNSQIRPPFDVSGFADIEQVEKTLYISGRIIFHFNCQQIITLRFCHDIE